MIKLVAIDLDGTLLNDQKALDLENIKAIQRVKSLGIKVTIFPILMLLIMFFAKFLEL